MSAIVLVASGCACILLPLLLGCLKEDRHTHTQRNTFYFIESWRVATKKTPFRIYLALNKSVKAERIFRPNPDNLLLFGVWVFREGVVADEGPASSPAPGMGVTDMGV